jgi:UDP-hydrolysing UDP-N-acetyl-D-glucosamine 2-epimerase
MKKRHICFVVYSRANYARIKTAIFASQRDPEVTTSVIVGASAVLYKYGNVAQMMRSDGVNISAELYNAVEGDLPVSMAKTTGLGILDLSQEFFRIKPDVVVTVADRFETLGTAIAASYMNITLAHTQGGEITGSIDESVRHACSKLAHIHFPATAEAKEVLLQMGEDENTIFLVGCPAIDLAKDTPLEDISTILERYSGVGFELNPEEPFLLVSQHPVTTEHLSSRDQINETLIAVEKTGMQTIWLWPNIDSGSDAISKKLREHREANPDSKIHFYRNFSAEDYVNLMRKTSCIIGNSSSGIRESSFLGVPSVMVGNRQQGRQHGENVITVANDAIEILEAIEVQIEHGKFEPDYIFGSGESGNQIVKVLKNAELNVQKRFKRR